MRAEGSAESTTQIIANAAPMSASAAQKNADRWQAPPLECDLTSDEKKRVVSREARGLFKSHF